MRKIAAFVISVLSIGIAHAEDPDGRALFTAHCSACHGAVGEGDGPVASSMAVTVPNLRTLTKRSAGNFPADAIRSYIDGTEARAAHGTRTMPVWGPSLTSGGDETTVAAGRARLAAIVEFVRRLQYP
ncbi:MAG: cytochrome c [Gammaproteobacteria bacterium]